MSWMRHNMTLVTHSMWSFWGWVEQSTLKCIDLCFFIIIIVIIIIFNGGNPPVTNPHHYHYCQNPTMVGFWLVGICRLAVIITIIATTTVIITMIATTIVSTWLRSKLSEMINSCSPSRRLLSSPPWVWYHQKLLDKRHICSSIYIQTEFWALPASVIGKFGGSAKVLTECL